MVREKKKMIIKLLTMIRNRFFQYELIDKLAMMDSVITKRIDAFEKSLQEKNKE